MSTEMFYESETTILSPDNPDFMSSTLIDDTSQSGSTGAMATHLIAHPPPSLKDDIKAVFYDPEVLDLLSKALAAQVTSAVRKEIVDLKQEILGLKEQVQEKDRQILQLTDRLDEQEQYSRRNSVRIATIPESTGENTDEIVMKVAESIGVTLDRRDIDRSHRVGKKTSPTDTSARPILVKFSTYRAKEAVMKARRGLAKVDATSVFPAVDWPTLSKAASSNGQPALAHRIYVNEDLTSARADLAAKARALKKKGKVEDTWVRDGLVFLKRNSTVHRLTTLRELAPFCI
nr:hypothetical protein BaRGS_025571 [Batillaria attramentaria]KAG5710831.1 hypothetical protein BaRGS_026982 [Batillaria attramentaria]